MNEVEVPKDRAVSELTLKPAYIDIFSPRIQMLICSFALLAVCLVSMWPSFQVGFLLDDLLHLDYVHRAVHGDWGKFLENFYSNWAGSPVMKSYRPLVSLSLLIDHILYAGNAWGYHLSNIILLWGCSLTVGLTGLELSGLKGNRLGASAAIWAALMFAIYPLHLEASAWIIGRVDLLCTFFYLTSVFCYLRFRLLRERSYFNFSLLSFAAALASKEMAVTLPLVISAAELLLYPLWDERIKDADKPNATRTRLFDVAKYWVLLGVFAAARYLFLHSMVGGYGSSSLSSLKNFLDTKTIQRIIFPANRDLLSRVGMDGWNLEKNLNFALSAAYAAILGCGVVRIIMRSANFRILAFLLFWMIVALLPTFQIWFISPNLVGSRLFFLSSAPMTLLLAFLALPAIDALNSKAVKAISCIGSIALLVIVSIWSYWLNFDLQSWTGAARSLKSFKEQVLNRLEKADSNSKFMLLNLPSDYSGAGMLACQNYLKLMLKPPLTKSDYSSRISALEPPPLSQNYDYAAALQKELEANPQLQALRWEPAAGLSDSGKISNWHPAEVENPIWNFDPKQEKWKYIEISKDKESAYNSALISDAKEITNSSPTETAKQSQAEEPSAGGNNAALLKIEDSGIRIKPINAGAILIFQKEKISPLKERQAEIKAKVISGKAPPLALLWLAAEESDSNSKAESSSSTETNSANKNSTFHEIRFDANTSKIEIELGRYPDWALAQDVRTIALYIPKGDYEIELDKITIR